ncbi:type II toxin-antitoxin system Phd/YefM family antitoxin [Candidatus Saccharibacteria bacterium]|nr:type II toxin-antitoxin system Phd/YefM family antitoxin [Candidatus Saccharibacteria bacterium]
MKAKIVSSTKLRENLAAVLATIDQDNFFHIITRRGKQEYAIISLDKLEDLLAAGDPQYLEEIAEARRQAAAGEVFALEDVFDDLK